MDREISIEERRKDARKRWMKIACAVLGVVAVVAIVILLVGESVKERPDYRSGRTGHDREQCVGIG